MPHIGEDSAEGSATLETGPRPEELSANGVSKVKVLVRARPLLDSERSDRDVCTFLHVPQESPNKVVVERVHSAKNVKRQAFDFDQVIKEDGTQRDVYEKGNIVDMVDAVLEGYNATIFAYGQTGSGKTYTMEGYQYQGDVEKPLVDVRGTSHDRLGIVPRSVVYLFDRISRLRGARPEREYSVSCSFIQIYNERIFDLLDGSRGCMGASEVDQSLSPDLGGSIGKRSLKLRFDSANDQFYVDKAHKVRCEDQQDFMKLYEQGVRNKAIASHNLNLASSRSHCLLTIEVTCIDRKADKLDTRYFAKFSLVDLAGSERVSVTGAMGQTLKEAAFINQSLFTLRKVIDAIASSDRSESNFVPYRDSKLTSLLQNSIGRNAHTLMVACIAANDRHLEENISTLAYAAKAKCIKVQARRNEDAKSVLIRQLKDEIKLLGAQLEASNQVSARMLEEESKRGLENNQETDSAVAENYERLKLELLSSVEMIKRMYEMEKSIRTRLSLAEARVKYLEAENENLMKENQQIREREGVLTHLLQNGPERECASSTKAEARPRKSVAPFAPASSSKKTQADARLLSPITVREEEMEDQVSGPGAVHGEEPPGRREPSILSVHELKKLLQNPRGPRRSSSAHGEAMTRLGRRAERGRGRGFVGSSALPPREPSPRKLYMQAPTLPSANSAQKVAQFAYYRRKSNRAVRSEPI